MSGARASAIPHLLAHLADIEHDLGRKRGSPHRRLRGLASALGRGASAAAAIPRRRARAVGGPARS